MTHGSLFSGIGGFDLAAEWMGWENVFHCEWNEFGKKILKYYWPNAISYHDITKTDFYIHRGQIDILTGGFPCQPYSAAGKRLGTEDDRHLWPEMLRAIREIQPRYVVGENVRGLTNWNGGLVFDQVQLDLENEGYEVTPFLLPACAVNAPHRRDRIWFVAYSNNPRAGIGMRDNRNRQQENERREGFAQPEFGKVGEFTTNSISARKCELFPIKGRENTSEIRNEDTHGLKWITTHGDVTNTSNKGLQGGQKAGVEPGKRKESGYKQSSRCNNKPVWWYEFPTQSPVCSRNDGLSTRLDGITFPKWRNESIKGFGNAIVPQVAYQIFKAIEQYENL